MYKISDKLIEAQKHALSICPRVGGFPVLAEILRQAGVQKNCWFLPSCQSIYFMKEGRVVQQGTTIFTGTFEIPEFNCEALISAIRKDQKGNSTFQDFLRAAWEAGVIKYEVDFIARKVVYYGINDESYLEEYPAIEIE